MAVFLVLAQDGSSLSVDHVTAPDIATAQTMVTNALQHGLGINAGVKAPVQVGLIQFGAAFTVTPT